LVPLIPLAAAAFRAFDRLHCWGPFSNSSMWKTFQRACVQLGLEDLTPYDFRHSFLSVVYAETRDLRVTGKLGSHRSDRTTKRYTLAAVAPHVQAAIDKVGARLAPGVAPSFGTHSVKQDEKV
jgi:integrase